jgi:hypothetical protein
MPSPYVKAITAAWSDEVGRIQDVLDLSVGSGVTSRTLAMLGFKVVSADYSTLAFFGESPLGVAESISAFTRADLFTKICRWV